MKCLEVGDKNLKIIQKVGVSWRDVAYALEFDDDLVKNIEHNTLNKDCVAACYETFRRWLRGEACQPLTWGRLIEALKDAERDTLARELEHMLTS